MARVQFLATVFDTRQRNQQGVLAIKLKRIYEQMCQEAAKIGLSTHFSDPAKEFYLKDFPNAEKAVSALLRTYSANITSLIDQGTLEAWELSEQKNAKMASAVASAKGMTEEEAASFAPRNREGLEAFRQRRVNGMNLSERVWDFVQHDKQKLELALEVGLTDGRSAAKLSRDVREYLNKPAKLFRRVRDRDGNLRLSKAAAAYHPGRGVYRSSYKNALRMTATETNMAYRTADHEAWANMPFVTGIIINLSKNHTCLDSKGVPRPFRDICDELKGEYPKDFKFVGWHPHCRCYVTAKLADQEEIDKYAVASDEERENFHFSNEVKDVPESFTSWIDENAKRVAEARSIPYFIRDNFVKGDIGEGLKIDNPVFKQLIEAEKLYPEEQAREIRKLLTMSGPEEINTQMRSIEKAISAGLETYSETFARGDKNFTPSDVIAELRLRWLESEDWAERVRLVNELKEKCAIKMRWELRQAGFTEGLEYVGMQKNFKLEKTQDYVVNGKTVHIKALNMDLVKFKDKYGIEYSYPIGDNIYAVNAASQISKEIVASMPKYARKQFKGLLLTEQHSPIDKYWQEWYKSTGFNFQHGAMYAGEPISIHYQYSYAQITSGDIDDVNGSLRASLLHELGHHVQTGVKDKFDWAKVIKDDNKFFRPYSMRAFLAKNNPDEDIADSFSMFITNPIRMQKEFPHRYRAIKDFVKTIT